MSYLHLPSVNLADFSKGTISLWFRFSQDSVGHAVTHGNGYQNPFHPEAPSIFPYTIPLVTFGRKVMANVYDSTRRTFSQSVPGGTKSQSVPQLVTVGEAACEPSYLGINCADGKVSLIMHFQTETRAEVQGLVGQIVEMHWELSPITLQYDDVYMTQEDISYVRTAQPESFLINPKFTVDTNKWHHLLVSFDFSGSVDASAVPVGDTGSFDEASELATTIRSYCKLWYAFDDENKNGKDNMGDAWVPQDANGIVTQTAKDAAYVYRPVPPDPKVTGVIGNAEYHWGASPLAMQGGPMGLPASAEYVDTIYHCEMAEFQMWTGVILDTGVTTNRRAFVDADGKPVKPTGTDDEPAPAVKLLGKKPEIMLHGSSNWKAGYNTGTTGVEISTDGEEKKVPGGQFTPVAGIEKYKPDPALEETETA